MIGSINGIQRLSALRVQKFYGREAHTSDRLTSLSLHFAPLE